MPNYQSESLIGKGFTSVGQEYLAVSTLPGSANLNKWVGDQFLVAKDILGIDKPGSKIKFKRSWANKILEGDEGKCHRHLKVDQYIADLTNYTDINFAPDITAVLYVDVPKNSSELIIINNGKENTVAREFDESEKYYILPEEGELIIFLPTVWHAVGIHKNKLPRSVYVFDADFV
jgi:hypothetical protein